VISHVTFGIAKNTTFTEEQVSSEHRFPLVLALHLRTSITQRSADVEYRISIDPCIVTASPEKRWLSVFPCTETEQRTRVRQVIVQTVFVHSLNFTVRSDLGGCEHGILMGSARDISH
jgi:hypothetical protein